MQGWHYCKGRFLLAKILAYNKSALCRSASPVFSFVVENDLLLAQLLTTAWLTNPCNRAVLYHQAVGPHQEPVSTGWRHSLVWLKRVCAHGIGCLFFMIGSLYNTMKVGDERSTCVVPTSFFSKKKRNIAGKIAS